MKYRHCGEEFEAELRSVKGGHGTQPIRCPKCLNFIPVNPKKVRPSHGKGNLK
jgi:hypothetical protein